MDMKPEEQLRAASVLFKLMVEDKVSEIRGQCYRKILYMTSVE